MFWKRERHRTLKGLAAGALGGLVGSFAMNQFQAGMSKLFEHPRHSPEKKERARQAQGWKEHRQPADTEVENATVKAAAAVSKAVLHHDLQPEERQPAGNAMHYAFGAVSGALYGSAAEDWDGIRAGAGSAFGAALWLTSDEIGVPLLKLSKPPQEYPLRVHAMALAAHLVYGFSTEIARRVLRESLRS